MDKVGEEVAAETQAIQEEVAITAHNGWLRRKEWILALFTESASRVSLGQVDGVERERAIGMNIAFKLILDRDTQVLEKWREINATEEDEKLEGGDLGVSYEASR